MSLYDYDFGRTFRYGDLTGAIAFQSPVRRRAGPLFAHIAPVRTLAYLDDVTRTGVVARQ